MHTCNPNIQEAEAGGCVSSKPAWSTQQVPGQRERHREKQTIQHRQQFAHQGTWAILVAYCANSASDSVRVRYAGTCLESQHFRAEQEDPFTQQQLFWS